MGANINVFVQQTIAKCITARENAPFQPTEEMHPLFITVHDPDKPSEQ
jgi:hypothetical protein